MIASRLAAVLGLWAVFSITTFAGEGILPLGVMFPLSLPWLVQSVLWSVGFLCCGHVPPPQEFWKGVASAIFAMATVAAVTVTSMSIFASNDRRYLRVRAVGILILAAAAVAGGVAFALSIGPGWRMDLTTGLPFVIVASVMLWRSRSVILST